MKGVEFWSVNDSGLVADEDSSDVFEGVEYYCSGVAETNLEDRVVVLPPPSLADCSVIFAEL